MKSPFESQIEGVVKCLIDSGFEHLQIKTLHTIMMFYHVGPLDIDSLCKTDGFNDRRDITYKRLTKMVKMGLIEKGGEKYHPWYNLHPDIRSRLNNVLAGG